MKLSTAAIIYLELGLDEAPLIRKLAACVACRYWMEMHRYGEFEVNVRKLKRLVKRFKLGDFICALAANYPLKK